MINTSRFYSFLPLKHRFVLPQYFQKFSFLLPFYFIDPASEGRF